MFDNYDIIIVGNGAVGAALACALHNKPGNADLQIAIIEAVSTKAEYQPSYDHRGLAISLSSKNILDGVGVWKNIAHHSNPIKNIHVSDQYHFGCVRMKANDIGLPALGYVVLASELGQVLVKQIQAANNIDLICPATVIDVELSATAVQVTVTLGDEEKKIRGRLLVAADGTDSKTRELLGIQSISKDYQQVAIVSNVTPERPHLDTAYERFTATGPVALLPYLKQRCVLVFGTAKETAAQYMQMDEQDFLKILLQRFSGRLGNFSKLCQRRDYPLKMLQSKEQVQHRVVILGNAAHTVHPNGAQGFNLGLRDAATLAEILTAAQEKNLDIGKLPTLESYLKARVADQQRVINFTDSLAKKFYNNDPCKIAMRNLAMLATDLISPLKNHLIHNSIGEYGYFDHRLDL